MRRFFAAVVTRIGGSGSGWIDQSNPMERRVYTFGELAAFIRVGDRTVLDHDFWMWGRTVYYSYPGPTGPKHDWSFRFRVPDRKNELAVPLTLARDPLVVGLLRRIPAATPYLPAQQQPLSRQFAIRMYRLRVIVYKDSAKKGVRFVLQNSVKPIPTNYVVISTSSVDIADAD